MTDRVRTILAGRERGFLWVFTAAPSRKYPDGGNQISERRLLRSLKRLLKRIGLSQAGKLHTFRHSFISKTLAKGVPSSTVRQWVGHVSDDILNLYTHLHDQQSQEAIRKFAGRDLAQIQHNPIGE